MGVRCWGDDERLCYFKGKIRELQAYYSVYSKAKYFFCRLAFLLYQRISKIAIGLLFCIFKG